MNRKKNQYNNQQQKVKNELKNQIQIEIEYYLKNSNISDKFQDLKNKLRMKIMRDKKDKIELLKV